MPICIESSYSFPKSSIFIETCHLKYKIEPWKLYFMTLKFYYMTLKIVIFICCTFASRGIPLCFTPVHISKNVIRNKKFIQSKFFLLVFQALQVPSWNVRSFLSFGLESSSFQNIRNFFRESFFEEKYEGISISINIRDFLILELESSVSWNMKNIFGVNFFYFFEPGLKSDPGSQPYILLVMAILRFTKASSSTFIKTLHQHWSCSHYIWPSPVVCSVILQ